MEEENVQAQDEVVEQEEQTSDDSQEETQGEESVTISKSEFKSMKRKAIAYDATKNKTQVSETKEETSGISSERFERLELAQEGYSKDEIDEIMDLGGSKVLKTNIVQAAIKQMRAEKKSKDASESPSSKSPVYKKFTQDDLSKMSSSELEKILPKD